MYRNRRFLITVLVFVLMLSTIFAWAHEAGWPGKRLAQVFPEAKNFKTRQVTLSLEQIKSIQEATGTKIGAEEKTPTFYIAYGVDKDKKSQIIGAVIFVDAVGERGNMEVNVAISAKGKLHAVSLWKSKESKQISSKEFLKQFNEEKKLTDPFLVGKDITAATGAEKASQAVATAAKKGWLMFTEVFGKKEANETSTESVPKAN